MKAISLAALFLLSLGAAAQPATPAPPAAASATAPMTDGEVRKIDRSTGKLTLRHGRIENLDMPGMTMVFRVSDPALLEGLKEGDKLRFKAEMVAGAITITAMEPAK
jgi:Cu/Ag efflux protein CusF